MKPSSEAQARIIAIGLARFLPWSAGAVPCGASAITTLGVSESPLKPISTDSAPGDRPEEPHHQVPHAVAVAVEGRDHQRRRRPG